MKKRILLAYITSLNYRSHDANKQPNQQSVNVTVISVQNGTVIESLDWRTWAYETSDACLHLLSSTQCHQGFGTGTGIKCKQHPLAQSKLEKTYIAGPVGYLGHELIHFVAVRSQPPPRRTTHNNRLNRLQTL